MPDEPTYDFYFDRGSCSLSVRIILEEGNFSYREHRVLTAERETERAPWHGRNPKGRVPALSPVPGQAGGENALLTEVPAILTWLARQRPELDLLPDDPAREARTFEWMNWLSGWLHSVAFSQLWRPERFIGDPAAFDAVIEKGRANLFDAFEAIEHILADGRRWAVPDAFTIADAFLIVFYRWGVAIDIDMRRYPSWTALTARTMARPAVQTAFARDELMPVPVASQ